MVAPRSSFNLGAILIDLKLSAVMDKSPKHCERKFNDTSAES